MKELKPKYLRKKVNPDSLGITTTNDVETTGEFVAVNQEQALRSMEFGTKIADNHYNMFITGSQDIGKLKLIPKALKKFAKPDDVKDWVYAHNFDEGSSISRPVALDLPAGKAKYFATEIKSVVEALKKSASSMIGEGWIKAFEEYEPFRRFRFEAFQDGIVIFPGDDRNIYIVPASPENPDESMSEAQWGVIAQRFAEIQKRIEKINKMLVGLLIASNEERLALENEKNNLMAEKQPLEILVKKVQRWFQQFTSFQKQHGEILRNLAVKIGVTGYIDIALLNLQSNLVGCAKTLNWLAQFKEDILKNIDEFDEEKAKKKSEMPMMSMLMMAPEANGDFLKRYDINVISSREQGEAPVIVEFDASFTSLLGYQGKQGNGNMFKADHMDIAAGAIHRANGGYLVIKALDFFTHPHAGLAWMILKKIIKNRRIEAEDLDVLSGRMRKIIDPEPIPWTGKIVFVGAEWVYYALSQKAIGDNVLSLPDLKQCQLLKQSFAENGHHFDEDFNRYFRVKVELKSKSKDKDVQENLVKYIATEAKRLGKPIDKTGVARLIECTHEGAEHQDKFDLRVKRVTNIIKEANVWAEGDIITAKDIETALKEKRARTNGYEKALLDCHEEKIFLVETKGKKIGQINGLYVLDLGEDTRTGGAARITAKVSCGAKGIVSIDRENGLAGPIHNKALGILTGFLSDNFAQEKPIVFFASIVFEQTYDGIEGDSATLAETCALLSALSGYPIKQELAITGSMDQSGMAQAIGGVNSKIQGFFNLCKINGFTGNQGVVIPKANEKHLMLEAEIVEKSAERKFHIYSVESITEAAEILMGEKFEDITKRIEEKLEKYRKACGNLKDGSPSTSDITHNCDKCKK